MEEEDVVVDASSLWWWSGRKWDEVLLIQRTSAHDVGHLPSCEGRREQPCHKALHPNEGTEFSRKYEAQLDRFREAFVRANFHTNVFMRKWIHEIVVAYICSQRCSCFLQLFQVTQSLSNVRISSFVRQKRFVKPAPGSVNPGATCLFKRASDKNGITRTDSAVIAAWLVERSDR